MRFQRKAGVRELEELKRAGEHVLPPRVFLWALVMGPFESGGVCSMGPCFVYGIYLVYIGVQTGGPYQGLMG